MSEWVSEPQKKAHVSRETIQPPWKHGKIRGRTFVSKVADEATKGYVFPGKRLSRSGNMETPGGERSFPRWLMKPQKRAYISRMVELIQHRRQPLNDG